MISARMLRPHDTARLLHGAISVHVLAVATRKSIRKTTLISLGLLWVRGLRFPTMIASRLPRRTTISLWQRPRHSLGVTPGAARSMPLIAVATRRLITFALLGTLVCLHTWP